MKKIVSGLQPSGTPHIGNYLGAMKKHIEMQETYSSFIFIADLHALTTVKNPQKLREMIQEIAIDYLALGLNPKKTTFFRQSHIPEHTHLAWILSCLSPMGLLERAHAYKDAIAKSLKEQTVGLFTYPVLMAADILLYQPDLVPVGKDQKQHIEITRDLGEKFNLTFGKTFTLPEPYIHEENGYILGIDGEHKMSKSYGNTIDFFADENILKKQIMSIKTDSKPIETPKNPETCNIFKIYSYFASENEKKDLKAKYQQGSFGYGESKKILLTKILDYFSPYRKKRIELKKNLDYVEEVLKEGAEKAKIIAGTTLEQVRRKTGL